MMFFVRIEDLKILYIGSLNSNSNSFRRYKALTQLSNNVIAVDTEPFLNNSFKKIQYHFNIGPGIFRMNNKIRFIAKNETPDIILVDNKPYLFSSTLKFIKATDAKIKIANIVTDDPFGLYGRSWYIFRKTAKLYDVIFVQREVNIDELKSMGVKKVELCLRSYDPDFNKPEILNKDDKEKYGTKVGFIGSYEDVRASYIAHLIKNGIPVSVTGAGWENAKYWEIIKPYYRAPFAYGDEFIKTICGMDIALHFLRHANRDEQDSRTFELPSSGTFMLAEKSKIHLSLFEDGKEAVYFDTMDDLLNKVKYYLSNPLERIQIAAAGYNRCITSGYSHKDRLIQVINTIINS